MTPRPHRPHPATTVAAAITAAGTTAYLLWVRPRILRWGATPAEQAASYPGDELVPVPTGGATMAATLPVRPEVLWPWLVQMGGDRGGWYSRDWLDNHGRPSADRIVPEWQHLEVGQRVARTSAPGRAPGTFVVAALEPARTLVLRSTYGMFTGLDLDPGASLRPRAWVDAMWGFHLRPVEGGATRLVVRTRSRGSPCPLGRALNVVLGELLHLFLQTRQFRNLERLATGPGQLAAAQPSPTGACGPPHPDRAAPRRRWSQG
ncbi:hypothetical protein GCM10027517_00670 [Phycicoccus ginsengisoli]